MRLQQTEQSEAMSFNTKIDAFSESIHIKALIIFYVRILFS